MQNSWVLVGARRKLRSKVTFSHFVPFSRLNNFVRHPRKTVKAVVRGKHTLPLIKETKNSLGPIGLVFFMIFQISSKGS